MSKVVMAFGEVLWDKLPGGAVLGGAPCNFAARIGELGERAWMVSRLGRDQLGQDARARLRALGLNDRFIQDDDDHPTGTVDIRFDDRGQPDYTINTGVAYDHIRADGPMLDAASEADCICFGTLAQRHEDSRAALEAMLEAADSAIKVLDMNLRKDCYTPRTIQSSLNHADLLKLNDDEARSLAQMLDIRHDDLAELASRLIEFAHLACCVITLGERGAFAASRIGEQVYAPGYAVKVADPCGSGDAFSAGFVHLYLRGKPLNDCCRLGNTLGAIVATQAGATESIAAAARQALVENPPARIVEPTLKSYLCDDGVIA